MTDFYEVTDSCSSVDAAFNLTLAHVYVARMLQCAAHYCMNMQVIFRTHREIPEMCLRRSNEESLLICIIDYYRNITYKGGCVDGINGVENEQQMRGIPICQPRHLKSID